MSWNWLKSFAAAHWSDCCHDVRKKIVAFEKYCDFCEKHLRNNFVLHGSLRLYDTERKKVRVIDWLKQTTSCFSEFSKRKN